MHEPPTTSHRAALQFSVPARCPSAAPGQAPLLAGSPPLSLEVNPLVTANLPMWATPRLLKERVLSHRQGLNLGWLSSVAMAKFGLHPESEAACTHWSRDRVPSDLPFLPHWVLYTRSHLPRSQCIIRALQVELSSPARAAIWK